ncbi:HAMP domain-containing sensor histidine kinase [Tenacibaculum sp. MAR_2010_89]|uniref:sensor histidine kinase n=1 Tax=Tenacibaculum sp. MAR_2010_89 TaxID=1250198 RepID=UPI0015A321BF|nr:HAMP domain-containing sensor histidine kinase [Tenacibaculum sp. MAR_2010_89]
MSIIGASSSYIVFKKTIYNEFNKKLYAEKEELIEELYSHENILSTYSLNIGDNIYIKKVKENPKIETIVKDTILYNKFYKKELNYRKIIFSSEVKGQFYVLTIAKSLLSTEYLLKGITDIIIFVGALFFLTMFFISNVVFKKIWKPFYSTLEQIRKFNVKKPNPLFFKKTKVIEFEELNTSLDLMVNQAVKDYKNLKEYTENISHEIQTPLAIIKNKVELLIQDSNLTEHQLIALNNIYKSTDRLSKLKENLSFLSKIDNNQFIETLELNVADFLREIISNVEELIQMKNINLKMSLVEGYKVKINEALAYTLFNNLIINAIKHNIEYGELELVLNKTSLIIKILENR